MRRLVAILLLTRFSLQSAWAVAAAYCQHQVQQEGRHFGHHADGPATAAALAGLAEGEGGDEAADSVHGHDCHAGGACLVRRTVRTHPDLASTAPRHAALLRPSRCRSS